MTLKNGTTLHHLGTGEKVGEIRGGWIFSSGFQFTTGGAEGKMMLRLCEIREPEEPFVPVGLDELAGVIEATLRTMWPRALPRLYEPLGAVDLRQIVEDYRKEKGQGK